MRPSIRPRPFVTFLPIASKKYLEVLLWVVSRDTARLRDDVLILSLRGETLFRRGNPRVLWPLLFLTSGSLQALRVFAMTRGAVASYDDDPKVCQFTP